MKKFLLIPVYILILIGTSIAQFKHGDTVLIIRHSPDPSTPNITAAFSQGNSNPVGMRNNPNRIGNLFNSYLWIVEISGKSYYSFRSLGSFGYLGIDRGSASDGAKTAIKSSQTDDIRWRLLKTDKGYKLKNLQSGFLLTAIYQQGGVPYYLNQKSEASGDNNTFDLRKYITPPPPLPRMVTINVSMDYIGVSEATRNRIDNDDCKKVFGFVKAELISVNLDGSEDRRILPSRNNNPYLNQSIIRNLLFIESSTNPTGYSLKGYSFHQDAKPKQKVGELNFEIDSSYFKSRNFSLIITVYLGSRHKDNNLASFDALKMPKASTVKFRISGYPRRNNNGTHHLTFEAVGRPGEAMNIEGTTVPPNIFQGDDTHNLSFNIRVRQN